MTEGGPIVEADEWQPMTHRDFAIGPEFETATETWRCTDIGTRTVAAIKVSDHEDDPSWFDGPPYVVAEVVFDEDDGGCYPVGSAEGRNAEQRERVTTTRPKAARSTLLAVVREMASDLHDAGVMVARSLDQLRATTDEASYGDDATRVLYMDGLAGPAARRCCTKPAWHSLHDSRGIAVGNVPA